MKSLDRLQAMLEGETADRPPFCFYQRWPLGFMNGESLATVCYAFGELMDPDVVVVPLAFDYPLPPKLSFDKVSDIAKIEKVHGNSEGWGRQIHALQRVAKANFGKRWVLQEVPSPWDVLSRLAGPELVERAYAEKSGFLRQALDCISESLASFARYAVEGGAQGALYRNSHASFDMMEVKEYATWGLPFDQKVWAGLRDSTFNIGQFVGSKPHLRDLAEMPFQAVGWSVAHGPKLDTPTNRWQGNIYGGINEERLEGSLNSVVSHVLEVLHAGPQSHWLVGSGEPLLGVTSLQKLEAIRDTIVNFRYPKERVEKGENVEKLMEERPRKKREPYERPETPLRKAPEPLPNARSRVASVPAKPQPKFEVSYLPEDAPVFEVPSEKEIQEATLPPVQAVEESQDEAAISERPTPVRRAESDEV